MATKTKALPEWRITYIKGTPATLLGYVEAANSEAAIKEAIKRFEVTDLHKQSRLAAVTYWQKWKIALMIVLALAMFALVIAYEYTGDFSGFAKFGTSSRPAVQ